MDLSRYSFKSKHHVQTHDHNARRVYTPPAPKLPQLQMITVPPKVLARIQTFKRKNVPIVVSGKQVNKAAVRSYLASITPPRQKITAQLRWEIAAFQKWKCAMCKKLLPVTAEIDHKLPRHRGGSDKPKNLQALCNNCHALKSRKESKSSTRFDLRFYYNVESH